MKNTERFSNRVENYVRYRPGYPKEIIPFLKSEIGLTSSWVVGDIGSGTGISTEIFLQNGNRVYAVEPNQEMRESAEAHFKNNINFISINGSAENTLLQTASIDLITSAQAFHWFDHALSKKEFHRIAKPNAYLLLFWNYRKIESGFQLAYENLLNELAIDYGNVNLRDIDEQVIRNFFSPQPYLFMSFPNIQYFDFQGLKGRLLSCSYAPLESHPNYKPLMDRLKQIFDQFCVNNMVAFEYACKLYYGHFH